MTQLDASVKPHDRTRRVYSRPMTRPSLVPLVCGAALLLPARAAAQSLDSLRARLEARIAATPAQAIGVYFQDLGSGDTLLVHANTRFHAASTMKVPVMIQLFRDRDAGRLTLDDSITVTNRFRSIVDSSPYRLDKADDSDSSLYGRVGQRLTIRALVELMETVSSNLATNTLIDVVGAARANATAHALGADSILVLRGVEDLVAYRAGRNNTTTARDLGVLLAALATDRAASPASCREMLAILERQHFTEGIPAGLPPGTRVAHKTGWIEGVVYHDAGIVYPAAGTPYVLVVLTGGVQPDSAAYALVADVSRLVYAAVRAR
jgi:beta-lactamase class A